MRLTRLLLADLSKIPRYYRLIRNGPKKWRDYQQKEYEPPYWYKWGKDSPYSPGEQANIRNGKDLAWYKFNLHRIRVVPPEEWLYRVGDKVQVLTGKDKGKTGVINKVFPQGNVIVVGGRNCEYRTSESLGCERVDKPLQHHEVTLLDPKDEEPTEVEFRVNKDGEKVRVSTRTGHVIYWPPEFLPDGTQKDQYVCADQDTDFDEACKVTYTPTLDGWEEELAKHYKVEDEPRRKTFWY